MDNNQRLSSEFFLKKSENKAKRNSPSLFEMSSPDTNSQNDKRLRFGLFGQESSGNNATSNDRSRLIPDFSSLCLDALANTPGPLGLRLKKTPSAIALFQMELDARLQKKNSKQPPETTDGPNTAAATAIAPTVTPGSTHQNSGNTTDPNTATSAAIATSTIKTATKGRPKAAHSPAVLLRIGTWEFASKYEGDIVAKIYFGKCQLNWEIIEDRKLKKLEINWSDVLALRKDCSAADYDTLQIVLHNPPRCFEEIATQPKKHTLWAKCIDFTNWQADTNRVHFLLFRKGSLHKHWNKFIEMAPDVTVLTSPTDFLLSPKFQFFKPPVPDDEAQNYDAGLANYPAPALPGSENSTLDGSQDPSFPFTCQLNLAEMEYPDLGSSWTGNLPANSFFSGDQDTVYGSPVPDDEAQNYDAGLANYPATPLPGSENSTLDGSQDPSFTFTCQLNVADMEYPDLGSSWNGNIPANSFFSGDQDTVYGSVSSEPLLQEPFAPTKDIQPGVNPNNLNGVQNQMQENCYGQCIAPETEPLIPANGPACEHIAEKITSRDSAQAATNMDEDTGVILQKLAHHWLSDAPSASGSSGCISRVASLCQLVENDMGDDRNSVFGTDYASLFTSDDVNSASASESEDAMDFQAPESKEAMSFQAPESSQEISEDPSEELIFTLPRIASLPQFVNEKK